MTQPDQSGSETSIEVHAEDVKIDTGAEATTEAPSEDTTEQK